jgi:hypothetical protein
MWTVLQLALLMRARSHSVTWTAPSIASSSRATLAEEALNLNMRIVDVAARQLKARQISRLDENLSGSSWALHSADAVFEFDAS